MEQRILSQKEIDELVEILHNTRTDGQKILSQEEIDSLVALLQGIRNNDGTLDLSESGEIDFGNNGILSQKEIDILIEKLLKKRDNEEEQAEA